MKNLLFVIAITAATALNAQIYDWSLSTTNTTNWIYGKSSTHLPNNQSVVVGHIVGFASGDFDPGSGSQVLSCSTANGAFVASYDYHGNYLWSFALDGNGSGVYLNDVASDAAGNIYITGFLSNISNVDFDPGPGTALLSTLPNAADYIYIASYDNLGNYRWAFMLGAAGQGGRGHALTSTPAGEVVVVGYYGAGANTFDFDPGPGTSSTVGNYGPQGFTAWYSSTGTFARVSTLIATGSAQPEIYDVSTDNLSSIYIAGSIAASNPSTVDFDPSAAVNSYTTTNYWTAFVLRYYPNGNLGWVNTVTGGGYIIGKRVSSDNNGKAYFGISYYGQIADVDPGPGVVPYTTPGGDISTCLIQMDAGTGSYNWSFIVLNTRLGCIEADIYGEVYICGRIEITQTMPDVDPGPGVVNPSAGVGVFVARYTGAGNFFNWIEITNAGSGPTMAEHMDATNTGELYLSGGYDLLLDFDPSSAVHTLPVSGSSNMFLARYVTHPTGISVAESEEVKVFPNPVNDVLTIAGDHTGKTIQVHSMLGETIFSAQIQTSNPQVDVSGFSNGIYFGELIDEDGTRSVFQFVKE